MLRHLLSFSLAFFLLLFLAVCGLWTYSYWHADGICWINGKTTYGLIAFDGRLWLIRSVYEPSHEPFAQGWAHVSMPPGYFRELQQLIRRNLSGRSCSGAGFWLAVGTVANDEYVNFLIPCWLPALLSFLWPAHRTWLLWRQCHRRRCGLCPTCSYDLRASKDKCPECGTPIPTTSNEQLTTHH